MLIIVSLYLRCELLTFKTMATKKTFLLILILALLPLSAVRVCADPIGISLQVRIIDPEENQPNDPRGPVLAPEVSIEDYTLYFDSSCHGCLLQIVDAEDHVVYSTTITSSTLVLPSSLEGVYELQIIRDTWCFYGEITL